MTVYRISCGFRGVKVERDSDEEAIEYARKYASRAPSKGVAVRVHRAEGADWTKIYDKEQ
jgi:hypothetical protein